MLSKLRVLPVLLVTAIASVASAQPALRPPAPFVAGGETSPPAGSRLANLRAAESAQQIGFPGIAAGLYREVLAAPAGSGGDRLAIVLALTSALLDDGDVAAAEAALQDYPGPKNSAWHLRAGLIAAHQRRNDVAKAELAAIKPQELAPPDVGWWYFLQGILADDSQKAMGFYEQATSAAVSALQRARFELARERVKMRAGQVSADQLKSARSNMETNRGRKIGYEFVEQYALLLEIVGQRNEAVAVLRDHLISMPAQEREEADRFRLLLGIIAGPDNGEGRNALTQLLVTGHDPAKQRIALQLLARASTRGAAQAEFRSKLDELIAATPPHPILEDLYLFRAQTSLAQKSSEGYQQAESDARALLQKFPASPLRSHAYGILTSAAWEQRRYRTAADFAEKARAELGPGQTRAELGVLIAEAWFRYGDFRSAAEAYAAALRELPAGVSAGGLMFQRVLAEIEAARADAATQPSRLAAVQSLIDEMAKSPAFEVVHHWQAEWNLANALQAASRADLAYARVKQLLATPSRDASSLPAELRIRMAWLHARLSLEVGLPEQTLKLAEELIAQLATHAAGADADLRREIASTTVLLQARAHFALAADSESVVSADREAAAIEILKKLRADFPGSSAAIYSYLVEAEYYDGKDRIAEAQQLLVRLADEYPTSEYAPDALYQAALLDKRRGEDRKAANRLDYLWLTYPGSDLVFWARLEQGDLLRKLNEFSLAEQAYTSLINAFPQHRGVLAARLKLADCHNAQATAGGSHAERAAEIYESLLAWPTAPTDLRVEAGFKLGLSHRERGNLTAAEQIWWRDVVEAFLLNPGKPAELGATGPYWMSRTLLFLGELREKQGKLEEAKRAWLLMLEAKLPNARAGKSKLEEFNLIESKS